MNSASETDTEEDEQSVRLIRKKMEARNERQNSVRYNFLYLVSQIIGLSLVLLSLVWVSHYKGGFGWSDPALEFNWHPVLMILGLVFLYGNSILVYRTCRNTRKKKTKLIHAGLHIATYAFAVIALKAAFDSHNYASPPKPNLYTLHSWVGLLTVIIFVCQLLVGFIAFLYPGLPAVIRQAYLHVHVNFGAGCFIMVLVTALMGLLEKTIWTVTDYSDLPGEGVMVNSMGILLLSFGLIVLYLVNEPTYKRIPLPEDEMVLTAGEVE